MSSGISLETNNKTLQLWSRAERLLSPGFRQSLLWWTKIKINSTLIKEPGPRGSGIVWGYYSVKVSEWAWTLGHPLGPPNYFVILNMGQGTRVAGIYYEPHRFPARIQNTGAGDQWLNSRISEPLLLCHWDVWAIIQRVSLFMIITESLSINLCSLKNNPCCVLFWREI